MKSEMTQAWARQWQASLDLRYHSTQGRTVCHAEHVGPLRVLQALYPEGPAVCHHVLVHPPSGLAGGDLIDIQAEVLPGAHAFISTPGASRFYRTEGPLARQRLRVKIHDRARLEWLPLETIAYNGCKAHNEWVFDLAPGAEMMAWDVVALGLPESALPFVSGYYHQHFEIVGAWLDRGRIDALDQRLIQGPLGLAGHRCLASMVMAAGTPMSDLRVDAALELARQVPDADRCMLGVTRPHPQVVVARVLADHAEPARRVLQEIWTRWRPAFWDLAPKPSRMWQV